MGTKRVDLTGKRSGRLVAIKDAGIVDKHGSRLWLCECDCGNTRIVSAGNFYKFYSCGVNCGLGKTLKKYDRNRIKLKPGRTYEEFIISKNADVAYTCICKYLGIDFDTAREIYDKIYLLDTKDIGTIKPPKANVKRRAMNG